MGSEHRLFLGGALVASAVVFAPHARADDTPVIAPEPTTTEAARPPAPDPESAVPAPQTEPVPTPEGTRVPETVQGRVYLRPHRSLVLLGVTLFGVAYTSAAITGAVSDRPSDRWLLAPFVGPWIDLGQRDCVGRPCGSNDDVAKTFVIASGLAQAAGLGILVWGLLAPEVIETRVEVPKKGAGAGATLSVTPTSFVGGAGVAALGTF